MRQRTASRAERDEHACVGGLVHVVRNADALAPEQQDVVGPEGEIVQGRGALGGEQHYAALALGGLKIGPAGMAHDIGRFSVIHGRAADRLVGKRETARLDDVHGHAHAGPETKGRAKVLRNVRLKKREQHSKRSSHGISRGQGRIAEGGVHTAIHKPSEGLPGASV